MVTKAKPGLRTQPGGTVLGHDLIRDVLRRALTGAGPAQTYLFSGAEGVGKRTVGYWFARLLLCAGRAPDAADACGQCTSCRKAAAESHPDIVEVSLLEKRATIGVEQAREVQRAARFAPIEGNWKIFLFTEAHRLTEQAMNSLLKLLEEPQDRRVFILMAPTRTALLPTILSRCQLLRFAPVPTPQVNAWLADLGADGARTELAAVLSEGRPGMALRMVSDTRLWDFRQKVLSYAASLAGADKLQLMEIAEKLEAAGGSDKRLAIERTLEVLTMWFRDVIWLQRSLDERRVLNRDYIEPLHEAATRYSVERVLHAVDALREARDQFAHNVNAKLMYMRLLLHLCP